MNQIKTLNFKTQFYFRNRAQAILSLLWCLNGVPHIISRVRCSTSTQLIPQPLPTHYRKHHVQHWLCWCRQVCEWQFRKQENPQWSRQLECLSQKNYIKRFQFAKSFFSHMLKHLEYRRAFYMYVQDKMLYWLLPTRNWYIVCCI